MLVILGLTVAAVASGGVALALLDTWAEAAVEARLHAIKVLD